MLVIWGVVFNKVFGFWKEKIPQQQTFTNEISNIELDMNFSKDTFDLKKMTRDPFLGHTNTTFKNIKSSKAKPPKIKQSQNRKKNILKNKKALKSWPKFSYYGFVKGAKSKSLLILIKINNQFHKVREGEKVENFVIKKVYRDSIKVVNGKVNKTILKSK